MITDRWQADEDLEKAGISTFEILEPSCLHCKKRNKKEFDPESVSPEDFDAEISDSCEEYEEIPWEICVAERVCELMEK